MLQNQQKCYKKNAVSLFTQKTCEEYCVQKATTAEYINARNRKKRLQYAKEYISEEDEWWGNVIFADEGKFNVYGSDGKARVWRKRKEELNPKQP